ncbi:MAG TPA: hypothetical protein VHO72_03820 [Bacteroidales bacterium]|nr:hypothetical protein [Bacteroidales bacterium]
MDRSSKNIVIIDKNLTLNGPATGLGTSLLVISFITGFVSIGTGLYFLSIWALALFVLGCFGLISIESIAIDRKNNSLKLYKDYYIMEFAKWYSIENYSAIRIIYSIDAPKQNTIRGAVTTWQPTQNKSFDVCLISDSADFLLLKHFIDSKKAKEFQKRIADMTHLLILEPLRMKTK